MRFLLHSHCVCPFEKNIEEGWMGLTRQAFCLHSTWQKAANPGYTQMSEVILARLPNKTFSLFWQTEMSVTWNDAKTDHWLPVVCLG